MQIYVNNSTADCILKGAAQEGILKTFWETTDLITIFDAILTSTQMSEKLQCCMRI